MDVLTIPPIGRSEGRILAAAEGRRYLDVVRSLGADDWDRATDCDRWTVRDIVAHTLGAAEGVASMREMVRQFRNGPRVAKELGLADPLDGINDFRSSSGADFPIRSSWRGWWTRSLGSGAGAPGSAARCGESR
ncbi:MAG TPA: maleylpyruvate isomerase family mycothiol-dependent enzyme [Acidimicrobiales bacterium]|nr:maleylpyruvate isomerase family mycothiol-dependent enzyme [Acidimicrobiales bacterium]